MTKKNYMKGRRVIKRHSILICKNTTLGFIRTYTEIIMPNTIWTNLNKSVPSNLKHFWSRFTRRFGSEVYTQCAHYYTQSLSCVMRRPRVKMKNE